MDPFSNGQLSLALKQLKPRVEALSQVNLMSRYESILESYKYMLRYMVDGYQDPQRENMYKDMLAKGWHLLNDVARMERINSDNALSSLYKSLENRNICSNDIIDMLRDGRGESRQHFEVLSTAFLYVFLCCDWREQDSRLWTAYLIDSSNNSADAQVMVSALMMACMLSFDAEKYKTLAYVYLTSDDVTVRQRALTGLMFGYRAPMADFIKSPIFDNGDKLVHDVICQVLEDENAASDVVSMIMQMFFCSRAEKDDSIIQKEIMPDIINGNPIKFFKDKGFIEKDDTIDDILNPGVSELAIEKMEQGIKRMAGMMNAGSDIFYKGFSQMKRYPFFYRLVNWFVPFDRHHPDVVSAIPDEEYLSMVERLFSSSGFCNSDKYSFIFAFHSILPTMPESMRKAMQEGTISVMGDHLISGCDDKGAYYRRQYLQDLFRFFKLSPQVKMLDVFVEHKWLDDFVYSFGSLLGAKAIDLARFMIRHNLTDEAEQLICTMRDNEQTYMLKAALNEKIGRNPYNDYNNVLRLNPDNVLALKGIARCQLISMSDEAINSYDKLHKLCPDVFAYELGYYQANVVTGKAESVLNDIYRLDFEHIDNPMVKRLLAWTLLCLGRFDKAKEIYNRIFAAEYGKVSENDLLSAVDLYYFSGDMKQCIESIHNYLDAYPLRGTDEENSTAIYNILIVEFRQLRCYFKVNPVDVRLLVDAVMA